jgi:hypothetical protein
MRRVRGPGGIIKSNTKTNAPPSTTREGSCQVKSPTTINGAINVAAFTAPYGSTLLKSTVIRSCKNCDPPERLGVPMLIVSILV